MAADPEADRRIAELERELARLQTESTYQQLEACLARRRLQATLAMAVGALGRMSISMDASVQRMADDLTGGG